MNIQTKTRWLATRFLLLSAMFGFALSGNLAAQDDFISLPLTRPFEFFDRIANRYETEEDQYGVYVFDSKNGKFLHRYDGIFYGFGEGEKDLLLKTDTNDLYVSGNKEILTLVNVETGEKRHEFRGNNHAKFINDKTAAVEQLSENGRRTVAIYDLTTGQTLCQIDGEIGWGNLKLSSDKRFLLTDNFGSTLLWDTTTWQQLRTFEGTMAQWSSDEKWVATRNPRLRKVLVWDAATGEKILTLAYPGKNENMRLWFSDDSLKIHLQPILHHLPSFAEDENGNIKDETVFVWEVKTGKSLGEYVNDPLWLDGKNVCLNRIWGWGKEIIPHVDLKDAENEKVLYPFPGYMEWSQLKEDGNRFLVTTDDSIKIADSLYEREFVVWNLETGEEKGKLKFTDNGSVYYEVTNYLPEQNYLCFQFHIDEMDTPYGTRYRTWDVATGQMVDASKELPKTVTNNRILKFDDKYNDCVVLWDKTTDKPLWLFKSEGIGRITDVQFFDEGRYFLIVVSPPPPMT